MKRWEYLTLSCNAILLEDDQVSFESKMDEYGKNGWELVSVITQVKSNINNENYSVKKTENTETIFFLKREIGI
ncbi:hypothetical protein ACWV26_06760 [Rummeliibacillus sp. JY-2-4R]